MSQFFSELTWNKIDWVNSTSKVRRSQRRIFKASRLGDVRKVKQLQQRLIRSPHAKLIAVQQVTILNKSKINIEFNGFVNTKPSIKLTLAKNLHLNGKATLVKQIWISKTGTLEKNPLSIPILQDRAKQALAKLALEPEWEAKFEPNSYGFRPGRSSHDAIEAVFSNILAKTDKFIYHADIRECFKRIDHDAFLTKLNTFSLMERQIIAWLKSGIMDEYVNIPKKSIMNTPQGGIISSLLVNIALHGLEEHLKKYLSLQGFPKPCMKVVQKVKTERTELGIIRYADDFVIIHRNPKIMEKIILKTRIWLSAAGLEISSEKSKLRKASQAFNFLGFQIILVIKECQYRVKISPSKESVKGLTNKIRTIIQNNKSTSSYGLIYLLRPILIEWGSYFRYCECKKTFKKVDNVVFNQIRAWVFRRATRQGRMTVKQKYFPENRVYTFQKREYRANWILNGSKSLKGGKPRTTHLPKMTWISSENFVKVKGVASVYDGNYLYWAKKCPQYSKLSIRVCTLLNRQKEKCSICKKKFQIGDHMKVDQIIQSSKKGLYHSNNLQLLHQQCHTKKIKIDFKSS